MQMLIQVIQLQNDFYLILNDEIVIVSILKNLFLVHFFQV